MPNITGRFGARDGIAAFQGANGAFYNSHYYCKYAMGAEYKSCAYGWTDFNASRISSIYKDNFDTVQPPAITIIAWKRIS